MSDINNFEKDVELVARHYDENAFKPTLKFRNSATLRNRRSYLVRWAAASVVFVALSAAAIVIGYQQKHSESEKVSVPQVTAAPKTDHSRDVIILEFEDAPISEVAKTVEESYGVTLRNVPDKDVHLTLHYEGNAYDFIDAVNEILNTNIEIADGKEVTE